MSAFISKIADTLGTNHVTRPFSCYKLIEEAQVEWLAAIIYEGSDAVFLNLATFVLMVVIMMVVMMLMTHRDGHAHRHDGRDHACSWSLCAHARLHRDDDAHALPLLPRVLRFVQIRSPESSLLM